MFESLRRWSHGKLADGEIPAEATVAAMDAAGVQTGMLCAWWGPRGPLITNDAVAAMATRFPGRFCGVAAVDLARPMDAVRELRRCVRCKVLFGSNHPAWPASDCLQGLAGLHLDDETVSLFLHGNAERVFGLDGSD
jgi:predicted TIM-barrel fold metal-dependent hydrolase